MNPLAEYREKNGLTRKALAQSVKRSETLVSGIERGTSTLSAADAAQWTQILGIDMSWAVGKPKKHSSNSPWRKARMLVFALFLWVAVTPSWVREWCVYTREGVEVFCWLEVDEG